VIDTNNTVTATIGVGNAPFAAAVSPNGQFAYVANSQSNNVSVIATLCNAVTATVAVGTAPVGAGIAIPLPFRAFSSKLLVVQHTDALQLQSDVTLGSLAGNFDPTMQPVTLQVGIFSVTIPPGSFVKVKTGEWDFNGTVAGVPIQAEISVTRNNMYQIYVQAMTGNPVPVALTLGTNAGAASVTGTISP
jgi:YVTN family beta-propeller protein